MAEKVTVGGLAVKLSPTAFRKIVVQQELTVIHGRTGIFTRSHVYLAVSGGITFYTKTAEPLPYLRVDIEARKIVRYISL